MPLSALFWNGYLPMVCPRLDMLGLVPHYQTTIVVALPCLATKLYHSISHWVLEEEFYKLRPANKTDHLCQSWQ